MELSQCHTPQTNHDGSHDNGTINPIIQNLILILQRHLEIIKKEQKHQQIINAQTLFEQISSEKLFASLGSDGLIEG